MGILIENINKTFGATGVLHNINLEVKSGKLTALLGPSGSGKTTLLRVIAGLEIPDSGKILLNGNNTAKQRAKERQVGFVFQHYALFKHMSVFENVAYGLRVRNKKFRPSEKEIVDKVSKLLKLVHMHNFANRYPSQLSGGQRQRVALARALAIEPKLLLLDEPFGALDAKVRKELRLWMRKLHNEIHITSIFVTHDQEEAMEVADEIVIMSNGKIEQVGTPDEVYHNPANLFVYDFLGSYTCFSGEVEKNGEITLNNSAKAKKLYSRPHEIYITKNKDDKSYIRARVIHINYAGSLVRVEMLDEQDNIIQAEVPRTAIENEGIKTGDKLLVRPKFVRIF